MLRIANIRLMANYNQRMNNTLFSTIQHLKHEQLTADQGVFLD